MIFRLLLQAYDNELDLKMIGITFEATDLVFDPGYKLRTVTLLTYSIVTQSDERNGDHR